MRAMGLRGLTLPSELLPILPERSLGRPALTIEGKVVAGADPHETLLSAVGAAAQALTAGELTPEEAASVVAVLEIHRKALETVELQQRLTAIERELHRSSKA